jgi:DNA-directed RNA polymerase specialized sigma24 family protein
MSTALLNHPVVVACIVAIVRGYGIESKPDIEDAVGDVQLRALQSFRRRPPPGDEGAMRALCAKIAENYCVDRWRKETFRSQYDMGLCVEDLEGHAPLQPTYEARDPVDERRQLAALAELFREGKMPELGAEILHGVASGESLSEIAEDLGITMDAVKGRLARMRRTFKARLAGIGLVVGGEPASAELQVLEEAA